MPYKNVEDKRAASKRYYQKKANRNKERREQLKNWLIDYKKNSKCVICGENHIACLEFHHKNPNEKEFSVSNIVYKKDLSLEELKKEIKKCVVLCANCHRKLHWEEKVK